MNQPRRQYRRPVFILALFVIGLAWLVLPAFRPKDIPLFFLTLGRMHPLIIHFPIVLIILALLFELARYFNFLPLNAVVIKIFLVAATLTTMGSIVAGFFLYASGDYAGGLMEGHFRAGVILGASVFITMAFYLLYQQVSRFYPFYLTGLVISNAVVIYTSHQGGSLTHGRDYLTEYLPLLLNADTTEEKRAEADMLVYDDMLAPILEAKCLSCHNAQRKKGGLSLATYQNLFEKGESNRPSVTADTLEKSESFQRVSLPAKHNDHMPPEGKTPMSKEEIDLLKYWIEAGASRELKLIEARKDMAIDSLLVHLLPELTKYRRRSKINKLQAQTLHTELDSLARKMKVIIVKDSMNEGNFYTLAMKFPPERFSNNDLPLLSPYYEVFSGLSLISSSIDDDGLYYIGQMANLKELYLQKTNLNGSGLPYLYQLQHLEILNLSFTNIDDKIAIDLLKIPALKEVYLYRTHTTRQVIDALRKNKPGLKIWMEEGPYF